MKIRFYIGILLLFSLFKVYGVSPFVLKDRLDDHGINKHFSTVFIDTTNNLPLKSIVKQTFSPINTKSLVNTNKNSSYWIKFLLLDKRKKCTPMRIEMFDFDIGEIQYYQQNEQGVYIESSAGFADKFDDREIDHKNVSFPINKIYKDSAYCYMRFKSHKYNELTPIVRTYSDVINYSLKEYILFGIFYGLLLLVVFYNLLYFFFLGHQKSLYNSLYALSVLGYFMSENGTGFQYLWPNHPWVNLYSGSFFLILSEIFLLCFTLKFLKINKEMSVIFKVIRITLIVRLITFVPQILLGLSQEWLIIDLIFFQVVFLIGIFFWKQGSDLAKWLVIVFSILSFAFIVTFLEKMGMLPSNAFTVYVLYGAVVIQFVFLSIAISKGIKEVFVRENLMQSELIKQYEINNSLSEKVNRELEHEVNNRTIALTKAQEELKTQADKITQMNLALDLANRKLEKEMSSVVKHSTQRGYFTFLEFEKAYPDNLVCKKIIEKLKLEQGFVCKKCNNEKTIAGKNKFDLRCSKCNYNESITANTIFHKTRFPLQKGFYMVYIFTNKDRLSSSLKELSSELAISYASISLFKNKVEMSIEKHKKKNKIIEWERIILEK